MVRRMWWRARMNVRRASGSALPASTGWTSLGATPEEAVIRAYRLVLGRAADPEGLAHYAAALRSGGDAGAMLADLVASEEFQQRQRQVAGLPPATVEYVSRALIALLLQRTPDADEARTYCVLLQQGATVHDVAATILASPEMQRNLDDPCFWAGLETLAQSATLAHRVAALETNLAHLGGRTADVAALEQRLAALENALADAPVSP